MRDELLGLPVKDHDYVVVGSDAEEMVRLGFRPVGKDFPVFLHPRDPRGVCARAHRAQDRRAATRASASTPRRMSRWSRTWRGATSPSTPSPATSTAISSIPHGGAQDLEAGILRHVEPGLRRRSGAHPAGGAVRRALRLRDRAGDAGADARDGAGRRGRPPGARARLAGARARPDGGSGPR